LIKQLYLDQKTHSMSLNYCHHSFFLAS